MTDKASYANVYGVKLSMERRKIEEGGWAPLCSIVMPDRRGLIHSIPFLRWIEPLSAFVALNVERSLRRCLGQTETRSLEPGGHDRLKNR